jgi:hypothetical protein
LAPIVLDNRGFLVYTLAVKECIFCKTNETPQWYSGPSCKPCYRKRDRLNNKEKHEARDRAGYEKNKEKRLVRAREYYKENSERIKARTDAHRRKVGSQMRPGYRAEWHKKNPEKAKEYSERYGKKYPGIKRKIWSAWNRRHKEYRAFQTAKRRAAKLQRTPKWLTTEQMDQIKEIYKNCPPGHDVDHIYPLQGEIVSGLHVPENLQYLPSAENRSKGNRIK